MPHDRESSKRKQSFLPLKHPLSPKNNFARKFVIAAVAYIFQTDIHIYYYSPNHPPTYHLQTLHCTTIFPYNYITNPSKKYLESDLPFPTPIVSYHHASTDPEFTTPTDPQQNAKRTHNSHSSPKNTKRSTTVPLNTSTT